MMNNELKIEPFFHDVTGSVSIPGTMTMLSPVSRRVRPKSHSFPADIA